MIIILVMYLLIIRIHWIIIFFNFNQNPKYIILYKIPSKTHNKFQINNLNQIQIYLVIKNLDLCAKIEIELMQKNTLRISDRLAIKS